MPQLTIDKETSSAVSQLGLNKSDQQWETNPAIDITLSRAAEGVDADYSVSLKSGRFSQARFFSDLVLQPSTSKFRGENHQVGNFTLTQYKAFASTNPSNMIEGFGVMLPTLVNSGFEAAGIANWLYVGPLQSGYFSGRQTATGSFVFGKPAAAAAVANMPSTVYSGFAQAGLVNNYYIDDFSLFNWTTSVQVDQITRTIKITVKTIPAYFFNQIHADETRNSVSLVALDSRPQVSFECTTASVSAGNTFECVLPKTAYPNGKIMGRFFGENGQEVAGTFTIEMFGTEGQYLDGTLVGAFVAKR